MSSSLADPAWWKAVLERVGRQLAQTVPPIVLAAGATHGTNDTRVALIAVGVAALVTLLKAVAGVRVGADQPVYMQLLDRMAPAFAGTMLGFIPADFADLGSIDWRDVFLAALAAAATAFVAYYVTPPSNVVASATEDAPPVDQVPGEAHSELETEVNDRGGSTLL